MRITVRHDSETPIYRQVAEQLKSLLAGGSLKEGDSLPSVRQLALDLGVNLNTIAIAYRELQSEGLIQIRHGSGAVVSSRRTQVHAAETKVRLRAALTDLMLAGLDRTAILSLVTDELRHLRKGEL